MARRGGLWIYGNMWVRGGKSFVMLCGYKRLDDNEICGFADIGFHEAILGSVGCGCWWCVDIWMCGLSAMRAGECGLEIKAETHTGSQFCVNEVNVGAAADL